MKPIFEAMEANDNEDHRRIYIICELAPGEYQIVHSNAKPVRFTGDRLLKSDRIKREISSAFNVEDLRTRKLFPDGSKSAWSGEDTAN